MGILNHRPCVKSFRLVAALLAACIGACLTLKADIVFGASEIETVRLQEQKIKSGLLYNFLKYTQWPDPTHDKMNICLIGGDSFGSALTPLIGRTAQQRVIALYTIRDIENPKIRNCSVVFIHRNQEENINSILNNIYGYPIITMSDIRGFSRKGGMVEFLKQSDQRIHVRVNVGLVQEAGLNLQDRLLKLVEVVD
ncbi:MAG: YfiR family protein [Alphaproteobacteria bacterium]|nr:YfiR family protein [Alphaproteobacteria bacterium]